MLLAIIYNFVRLLLEVLLVRGRPEMPPVRGLALQPSPNVDGLGQRIAEYRRLKCRQPTVDLDSLVDGRQGRLPAVQVA